MIILEAKDLGLLDQFTFGRSVYSIDFLLDFFHSALNCRTLRIGN